MLRYFRHDGVYADQEGRAVGGGSLNLTKLVALEFGLEDGESDVQHGRGVSRQERQRKGAGNGYWNGCVKIFAGYFPGTLSE